MPWPWGSKEVYAQVIGASPCIGPSIVMSSAILSTICLLCDAQPSERGYRRPVVAIWRFSLDSWARWGQLRGICGRAFARLV